MGSPRMIMRSRINTRKINTAHTERVARAIFKPKIKDYDILAASQKTNFS